jgi:hypothetical protein
MALLIMAVVVFGLAVLRFRRDLAPTRRTAGRSQGASA